jgi:hypothetical protein
VVAFLERLPLLSVADYLALEAPPPLPRHASVPEVPDPKRGKRALWLRAPQAFSRHSAMPTLGVTERDARDIAAHLATLK